MIGDSHTLTTGWLQRHVPPASKLSVDIAILDIAQDFLLAHLHESGVFNELVVFKGGTALRKLFAGAGGRFSTDVDLALRGPSDDRAAVAAIVAECARVTLGPFAYAPLNVRGRWQIAVTSPWGTPAQTIKLDVGPPCWLTPEERPFVTHMTHPHYGFSLPPIPCMRFEEILAEKIARLSRLATARDAFDLVWAATTSPYSQYDRARVRRLAVLKVWVDRVGLLPAWGQAIGKGSLIPEGWLSPRDGWDDEQIGMLAHPAPTLETLERDFHRYYQWLRDLTPDELQWAAADARHRRDVIEAILQLPNCALGDAGLR